MEKYIKKYEKLDLTRDDLSRGFINKFKIDLTENNGEIIVAIVNRNLSWLHSCDYCYFKDFGINLQIDTEIKLSRKTDCREFCEHLGKEIEKLEGIEANTENRKIIILKANNKVVSIDQEWQVDLIDLKNKVCSIQCCGDIDPNYYMRKGCWMKEENCCPLRLLINQVLKY